MLPRSSLSLALPLKAVGIEDNDKIYDGQLTSSTSEVNYEAWRGRLHGQGSWKPGTGDQAPRFNITLYLPVNVTYIATQGSPTEDCWTTTFRIYYKMHGGSLKHYSEVFIMATDRKFVTWLSSLDWYLKSLVNVTDCPKKMWSVQPSEQPLRAKRINPPPGNEVRRSVTRLD